MKKDNTDNLPFLALITLTATLGGFLFGFDTAVVSGTISLVRAQYQLRSLMEGWYVSSALLGCIAGVALSGKTGHVLGRKKTMFLSALLFFISAIGCAFSPDAFRLIVFRLIGGTGIGVASVICPLYISEVAPANSRGKLVSFYQLAITVGILVAYFSNASILAGSSHIKGAAEATGGWMEADRWKIQLFSKESWRGMFAVGIFPAILFAGMIFFIPESPRWLALRKNELGSENSKGLEGKIALLFRGPLQKPLLIGILLAALSQFSGINAIIYYGPSVLEKAGFRLGDALGGQVTIGLVNLVFTFVAIQFIDQWGRKPLLMSGIAGAVLSLLVAAILFAAQITSGWLVLIPILLFIACFSFSFGSVTWVVLSEIFPTAVRSEAVAICTLSLWVANWIVGQFFPLLVHATSISFPFLVFALFSSSAFFLCWKKIPETRGRSLEEIEKFWEK